MSKICRAVWLIVFSLVPCLAWGNQALRGFCETGNTPVVLSGLTSSTVVQGSFPLCSVLVSIHGGSTASIFSDNVGTPLGNPFTANTDGSWRFYAANGHYDVTLSGGGLASPVTLSDVLLNDPTAAPQFTVCTVAFSATPTFNGSLCNIFVMTLTGNVTSSTFTGIAAGDQTAFILKQDGTGSRTFSWPSQFVDTPGLNSAINSFSNFYFIADATPQFHQFGSNVLFGTQSSPANQFFNSVTANGIFSSSQPAFSGISGTLAASQGGTGSTAVPSSGQVPVGNAGGTAYAPQTVSGDTSITSAGVETVSRVNGAQPPASALVLATNSSRQLTVGTGHGVGNSVFCSSASGSGTTYTCSTTPSFTPADGDLIDFDADVTNTGSITLNVNASGAITVKKWVSGNSSPTNLIAGDIQANQPTWVYFDAGLNIWSEMSPTANTTINGGTFPTSATVVGSNASAQPIAATTTGSGTTVVLATSPSIASPTITGTAAGAGTLPVGMLSGGVNGNCAINSSGTWTAGSCAGTAGVQMIGTPNTTPVTVNANTTGDQTLSAACASTPCYSAGALNSLNKTIDVELTGSFAPVNTSENIVFKIGIAGAGTNNFALVSTYTPTNTNTHLFSARLFCTVTTTGASGIMVCSSTWMSGFGTDILISTTTAQNVTGINLTGTLSPTASISFSTASATNTATTSWAWTHQHN